jgi:glycosyltransferase involved in cell wall biosynthesis
VLFLGQHVAVPDGTISPHGSGAHTAATLAGLRAHFDVEAVLAAGDDDGPVPDSAAARAWRGSVPEPIRGVRRDLSLVAQDLGFGRRASLVAARFRPDAVYERSEYMSTTGLRLARRLAVPLVLEVNGLLDVDARTMYRSLLEPAGRAVERRKHRRADIVVTVSPGLAELLERRGASPDRVAVVPNSVDPDRVSPAPRPTRSDGAVVGWVGHLMPWHLEALGLLAAAAPRIREAVPAVSFRIVGGGPGLEDLQALVRARGLGDAFEFLGPVAHERVQKALAEVDVGVIPAVFDYAFPVKLVEMGALGLPVVAPQSGSLDRMLAAAVEYEPFAAGDRVALEDALIRVLRDPARRGSLGAALHRATIERFTWTATGELAAAAVRRALSARGA